jgi:hypothetical protein
MRPYNVSVSSKYGAPMGRRDDTHLEGRCCIARVPLYDGDYDKGGAYWGGGGQPLFCAWNADGARYCRASGLAEAVRSFSALGLTFKAKCPICGAKRTAHETARFYPACGKCRDIAGATLEQLDALFPVLYMREG